MRVVVIGGGINGMVAAAELGHAGHSVQLVDAGALGGFVADGTDLTLPGFVHDTYSSWHPLFVSGAAYAELGDALHEAGLEYVNAEEMVTASTALVGGEPRTVYAHRDPGVTASMLPGTDGPAYLGMLDEFGPRAGAIFGALGTPLAHNRSLARLAWQSYKQLKAPGVESLLRDGLMSARNFLRARFASPLVDQLWTPWGLHSGLSPDSASGGMTIPVFAAALHQFGLPIVKGGVRNFLAAFRSVLAAAGVEVLEHRQATAIHCAGGKVSGVELADGRRLSCDTVLASVTPQALAELLPASVAQSAACSPLQAAATRYRPGRAAMQIHLALNAPVPWSEAELGRVPLVHLSDGSGSTGISCAQAEAGLLPSSPTVVVGQQSMLDPSRAPSGQATLWLQLQELPWQVAGDAAGEIDVSGGWENPAVAEAYADRVLARLEAFATGLRELVLARHIITPRDLAARNANAVHGDPYAGSAELDQNLRWRPGLGLGHDTPVGGLWHIGAATHPGPGLGGASGHLVAQRLLKGKW